MNITSYLFEAYLKCPTKCFLRSRCKTGAGNEYADWVRTQTDSYRNDRIKDLKIVAARNGLILTPPLAENQKVAESGYTFDFVGRVANLESHSHIIEQCRLKGPGKPVQFIPTRFIYTNKISPDDKLLLAFDALVLSEVLGREVGRGKIVHGDNGSTLTVKTPVLARKVLILTGKITNLLSNDSPPDLILNRHCAECEFKARCRQIRNDREGTQSASQQGHLHRQSAFLYVPATQGD